ncbi:MAG: hypothetical protein K2M48_05215 [Clostridiales bacterium]|nr:hypothetical protein [Clostridiales bacterium]
MENIFENFVISVLKLNRLVSRIKMHEMKEYGLKSIHVMCIYYLNANRSGMTASELMRVTFEDKAAISRALALLREKNYIEYDDKKYNSVIKLTADGVGVANYIAQKADKAVAAGSAEMTDEERITFYKHLNEIADNLFVYYSGLSKGEA